MPVEVRTRTAPPAQGAPSEIDSLFVVMNSDTAGLPLDEAVSVRSLADFVAAGGSRTGDMIRTYDGLDAYFREGGRQAYVARYTDAGTLDAGLALLTEDLGGGQIVAWDATPDAALYGDLLDAAEAQRRFALLDVTLTDETEAELDSKADLLPTPNAEYGALFGPWATIPAPDGVVGGSARQVPATAVVAALIARADALGNPNRAPAGRDFLLQYVTSIVGAALGDQAATNLRAAGLNPLRTKFGLMVLDGFQTSIDPSPDTPFWQANCGRARMWLQWRSLAAGMHREYKPIDGRGRLLRAFQTDLDAICLELYNANGLFGNTPQEAFATTVGVSVNTDETIAQGELHAVVEARFSLHAKTVIIELVSVPVTGRVSAAA